jgi:hypothetical protein
VGLLQKKSFSSEKMMSFLVKPWFFFCMASFLYHLNQWFKAKHAANWALWPFTYSPVAISSETLLHLLMHLFGFVPVFLLGCTAKLDRSPYIFLRTSLTVVIAVFGSSFLWQFHNLWSEISSFSQVILINECQMIVLSDYHNISTHIR